MGYKILEVENGWKVSFSLDRLIINIEERKIPFPINDINIVLIDNMSCLLSTRALVELQNRNIVVILCDMKHLPNTLILPISGHYDSLKKIQKQYQWSNEFKNEIWTRIVKMKINSQINLIEKLENSLNLNYLRKLLDNIKNNDSTNREAVMANEYFSILFGKTFIRNNDGDEYNKCINSFLNYGYTILLSIVCRSIVKLGYDTRLSIWHKSFSNHTALGSDLMEPFRCLVDECVYKLIRQINANEMLLGSEIKKKLITIFTKDIIINNERMQITNAIDSFVQTILDTKSDIKLEYIYDQQ